MIFSLTTEYALRAVVHLADSKGEARTAQAIAEAAKVPVDYLAKIMQNLRRAGIVSSQRGVRGGFVLSRPASEITMLEVVNAIDPIQRIRTCPLRLKSHGVNLCALHRTLDRAIASVEVALGEGTIEMLLKTPSLSHPLCDRHTA